MYNIESVKKKKKPQRNIDFLSVHASNMTLQLRDYKYNMSALYF